MASIACLPNGHEPLRPIFGTLSGTLNAPMEPYDLAWEDRIIVDDHVIERISNVRISPESFSPVFYGDHPRHAACLRLLEDATKKTHFCAAHSVTELYAVMTRLPVRPRITPEQGLLFVENVRDYFSVVTPSAGEQFEAAADAARRGLGGSKIYDLLTLKCAAKAGAERVYALRLPELMRMAPQEIRERLEGVS